MVIKVDDQILFTLSETHKSVLKNEIPSAELDAYIKNCLEKNVVHQYEQHFKRLKAEWEPRLEIAEVESVPVNKDAFSELVFARGDYEDRDARDA